MRIEEAPSPEPLDAGAEILPRRLCSMLDGERSTFDVHASLPQPLVPVPAELVHVVFGDSGQGIDDAIARRILSLDDFVEQDLHGLVAPAVAILREQRRDMAAAACSRVAPAAHPRRRL